MIRIYTLKTKKILQKKFGSLCKNQCRENKINDRARKIKMQKYS